MSDERSTSQVNVTGDGNVVGDESLAQVVKAENGSIIGDVVQIGKVITHLFSSGIDEQRAYRNRRVMLQLVRKFWIEGVLEQSLHGVAMIELGMEEKPDAVEHPWDMVLRTDQGSRALLPGTRIMDVFGEIGGSLLILGEPGSGKTTMLLELTRDTITRAEQDLTQPIPVVLSLSSWADKAQSVSDWLVVELNAKYDIPRKVATLWVESDELLLLLDGLDEVRPEHREACVKAINDFRQEHGLTSLVICSRVADYEALSTRLKLQGAVLLQPLTLQQIDQYLDDIGTELLEVRRTLQRDPTLQELAQSPLMLSIMTLAYRGMSIGAMGTPSSIDACRKHIFDAYVRQIFERRGTDQYYPREQTLHWLSRLAQRMTEKAQSVFLIERIQPDWLPTRTQRWLHTICVMLVTGIPIGLLVGLGAGLPVWLTDGGRGWTFGLRVGLASALAVWLAAGRTFGPTGGLLVGSAFGLAFGMTFGDFFGQSLGWAVGVAVGVTAGLAFGLGGGRVAGGSVAGGDKIVVVEKLKWLWPRAILGLIIGLIAGGIFGQTVWQAVGRFFDPGFGWTFGVAFGLASGLVAGLFSGLTSGEVEMRMIPNQGIRWSAQNAARIGLATGLAVGLPVGLASERAWALYRSDNALTVGLTIGLTIGSAFALALGLLFGGLAFIQHFILRFILYLDGYIPWNCARFLDYAAERIFMRKVGGGYIFVHRLLQDYFGSLYRGK